MKKLLLIPLLLITLLGNSQDKRFTASLRTEFADANTHNEVFDFGFNIGARIEYQMTITYFNAELYYFPGLNGIDYAHFQGTVLGFNHHSWDERWRFHLGLIKPGVIFREGPHALIGSDAGIEYYFGNNYFGLETGYDFKGDSALWGEEHHEVWYLSVKFGFIL